MAGAEGGDDTRALRVPVKPLLTDAALRRVAAVDRRGVNVLAAPLAQRSLDAAAATAAPPPLLPGSTRCRREREGEEEGKRMCG